MTAPRARVAAVVLLRESDGAALLQHRDNKPGLPHANLWVPPGGHCDDGETWISCAGREFFEETDYRCANLRYLTEVDVDDVPDSAPFRLAVYWDVYDSRQPVVCREGQALAFIERRQAHAMKVPGFLIALWDQALTAWRAASTGHDAI